MCCPRKSKVMGCLASRYPCPSVKTYLQMVSILVYHGKEYAPRETHCFSARFVPSALIIYVNDLLNTSNNLTPSVEKQNASLFHILIVYFGQLHYKENKSSRNMIQNNHTAHS